MNGYPSEISTQQRHIHTNSGNDFQVFGTVDINPVHRDFHKYGPNQNYIPYHTISEKSKPDLYKLDNASNLLHSNTRQYFDYSSYKNNHFRFSSAYSKSNNSNTGSGEEETVVNKGLELQHVIDHLKFMMKQRRKPLRIDHNASKLLGLPSYCAYISKQEVTEENDKEKGNTDLTTKESIRKHTTRMSTSRIRSNSVKKN